ncbi:MAG: alpha/beta hydrolase [Hyphomicrobiaceae bacterium]
MNALFRFGCRMGQVNLLVISFLASAAIADPAKNLARLAERNIDVQRQLIAVGTLASSRASVPLIQLQDAAQLFVETYVSELEPTDSQVLKQLAQVANKFVGTVGLRNSEHSNGLNIRIPLALLPHKREISPGVEILRTSGDPVEAMTLLTFVYPVVAQTPRTLLREIFYKNENLAIAYMTSSDKYFVLEGTKRAEDGSIDHHFSRRAYQVGSRTTAIYSKYDHLAPEGFAPPDFVAPFVERQLPPSDILGLTDGEERLSRFLAWTEVNYAAFLQRRHPPSSITDVRAYSSQKAERLEAWRQDKRDAMKRDLFAIAVLDSEKDRLAAWNALRVNLAWRTVTEAALNIALIDFETRHAWKQIEITGCHASFANNDANRDYQEVRVVYATNRKRGIARERKVRNDPSVNVADLFVNATDPDDDLHYGCVFMTVPKDGATAQKRQTRWEADWLGRSEPRETDLKKFYSLRRNIYLGSSGENDRGERVTLVDRERVMARREDIALVYIHGYNTSFDEALLHVAQLAATSRYPGRVFLFSWPSARSTPLYVADMDASEKSDPYLAAFLRSVLRDSEIRMLDVVTHSMGGQIFLRAFSRIRSSFDQIKPVRLGRVVFAAPDVAVSVFDEKIKDVLPFLMRGAQSGVVVYTSELDRVLRLSSYLRGGRPRLGYMSSQSKRRRDQVTMIDATRAAWWCNTNSYSMLGHSYIFDNDRLMRHVASLLRLPRVEIAPFMTDRKCWYNEP